MSVDPQPGDPAWGHRVTTNTKHARVRIHDLPLVHTRVVHVVSGDALHGLARAGGAHRAEWVEAKLLDTVRRHRDDPAVVITWKAACREQPAGAVARLPWQPGRSLPDLAYWAECTVEVVAVPTP